MVRLEVTYGGLAVVATIYPCYKMLKEMIRPEAQPRSQPRLTGFPLRSGKLQGVRSLLRFKR